MKGFILAAGVGSRLKPWTDSHPKALAPVGGIPMLERVVNKMCDAGIFDITVNVHHFADQIIDFIKNKGWKINISHEQDELLETGGAILNAKHFLEGDSPTLVHNVDILSSADFPLMESEHLKAGNDATLLVSDRKSSRKLIFNGDSLLRGWHDVSKGKFRPTDFESSPSDIELAFNGVYIISPSVIQDMTKRGFQGRFSIIDYFLEACRDMNFKGIKQSDLEIIDIGKPDSYNRANLLCE